MEAINNTIAIIGGLFRIAGSLAMFLYGMKIMSDGIQKTAGERLQQIMNFMTNNRFTAILTGFLITCLIQSSSATTVMVVSFVNASLLNLTQAIGVIMGANIGTTITGWIVALFGFKFNIALMALPCIGIGFPLFFSKMHKRKYMGEILVGFGLLFLGLTFLKDSVPNIKDQVKESVGQSSTKIELKVNSILDPMNEIDSSMTKIDDALITLEGENLAPVIKESTAKVKEVTRSLKKKVEEVAPATSDYSSILNFIKGFTGRGFLSFLFFVFIGTIVTIIVQSSSAAMAITLTLLATGWIEFDTAAAIVLGENIGTTITAYLASLGANVHARRAARAHTLFNIFGVIWMAFAFPIFLKILANLFPHSLETRLAMFHTLFNVTNTVLFIGFIPFLAKLVEKMVKPSAKDEKRGYSLEYLHTGLQDTPEINILKAKSELFKMAEITENMFMDFLQIFHADDKNKNIDVLVDDIKDLEEVTDNMQLAISQYLVECAKENLNEISANNVNAMIRIVHELESIGDSCFNLALLSRKRINKKLELSEDAIQQVIKYAELVKKFMQFNKSHLNEHLKSEDMEKAIEYEKDIDENRTVMTKGARKRLRKGADVHTELLFIDIVKHLEHIGDYSLNIAQALRLIR